MRNDDKLVKIRRCDRDLDEFYWSHQNSRIEAAGDTFDGLEVSGFSSARGLYYCYEFLRVATVVLFPSLIYV